MDVTCITSSRGDQIENASVITGTVNGSGHLILTTKGGTQIDAGLVRIEPEPAPESKVTVFTTNGTWTKDPDARIVRFIAIGGGGGGSATAWGIGGGGGGYSTISVPASILQSSISVVVGSGGLGGAAGVPATAGGASSVDGVLLAPGGNKGGATSAVGGTPLGNPGNMYAGAGGVVDGVVVPLTATYGGGGGGASQTATASSSRRAGGATQNGLVPGGQHGVNDGLGGSLMLDGAPYLAGGGGAGGHISGTTAIPGANGGLFGGGGGAGATYSGTPGSDSGGGNGAQGVVVVIETM